MTKGDPIWPEELLGDVHARPDKAERVKRTFNLIAARYDLANVVISFGLSEYARGKLIRYLRRRVPGPQRILDLCAGPATLSRRLAKAFPAAQIMAVDFAVNMLHAARRHALPKNHHLVCADALALPFENDCFDLVTCVYGLRNLQSLPAGLAEIHRVLRGGALLAALDFQIPQGRLLKPLFGFYFTRVLPRLGAFFTGTARHDAYAYLPHSVTGWHDRRFLVECLSRVGFVQAGARRMGSDAFILLTGVKRNGLSKGIDTR